MGHRTSEIPKPIKTGPYSQEKAQQIHIEDEGMCETAVLFINEESLSKSPQITIKFEEKFEATAILDSGSEVNIISLETFNKLSELRTDLLTLPVQGVHLVTAFGRRSEKIKLQVLLEFCIECDVFEAVFFISPQLNSEIILGCNFLKERRCNYTSALGDWYMYATGRPEALGLTFTEIYLTRK
jgi:PHD/YefM family antitoxin component YafN of YafNO toxin-antitoxin module